MGVDLCQYGNHTINFKNRDFEEIAQEIKHKLDKLKFFNEDYLRFLMIDWESSSLKPPYDEQVLKEVIIK